MTLTVRNIIPAVPGLGKGPPIIGKEILPRIGLNESKNYLGVSISLLVQERMIFSLFCSVYPRIGTIISLVELILTLWYQFTKNV